MTKHYQDYFWKDCIPYGLNAVGDSEASNISCTYKIIMDPYRKRISIERYRYSQFDAVVYDSALLNFRHLNETNQQSWQKTIIREIENRMECIIRDQDDRIVFIETYFFQNNLCKECRATSPQGILLSVQKMRYKHLGDKENDVILFDANEHPVMQKIYEADPNTGEFTNLIQEILIIV